MLSFARIPVASVGEWNEERRRRGLGGSRGLTRNSVERRLQLMPGRWP
jgi:hypothetical protein